MRILSLSSMRLFAKKISFDLVFTWRRNILAWFLDKTKIFLFFPKLNIVVFRLTLGTYLAGPGEYTSSLSSSNLLTLELLAKDFPPVPYKYIDLFLKLSNFPLKILIITKLAKVVCIFSSTFGSICGIIQNCRVTITHSLCTCLTRTYESL